MPDSWGGTDIRLPPSNVQAEQALLGAILTNNKAYDRVADFLLPVHFADPIHAQIYDALSRNIDSGRVADAVTLKAQFEHAGILEEVGGTKYLTQLLTAMIGIINAGDYGRAIYSAWQQRELIEFGTSIANKAWTPEGGLAATEDIIDQAQTRLMEIGAVVGGNRGGVPLSRSIHAAVQEGENAKASGGASLLSTGLPSLDEKILGLRPDNLIVIAGRPGMGKSAMAKGIALNVALGRMHFPDGQTVDDPESSRLVLYFSFESGVEDFGATCAAELASVSIQDVLTGKYGNEAAGRIVQARQLVAEAPFKSFHKVMSLRQINRHVKADARRFKVPLGLVVVDYLQLMPDHKGMDKRLSVGTNAYGLKELALELKVPVILLSQLSRQVETRPDKRPTMADLRETGAIEDAADVIIFPYREAYYLGQARPPYDPNLSAAANGQALSDWQSKVNAIINDADLLIPKVRRGEAPTYVRGFFNGQFNRFEEPRS